MCSSAQEYAVRMAAGEWQGSFDAGRVHSAEEPLSHVRKQRKQRTGANSLTRSRWFPRGIRTFFPRRVSLHSLYYHRHNPARFSVSTHVGIGQLALGLVGEPASSHDRQRGAHPFDAEAAAVVHKPGDSRRSCYQCAHTVSQ